DLPQTDLVSRALTLAPNAPAPFNENGEINWADGLFTNNPMAVLLRDYQAKTNNMIVNMLPSWSILPGLRLTANLGYTRTWMTERQLNPKGSYTPSTSTVSGTSYFGNGNVQTWVIEPRLNYE